MKNSAITRSSTFITVVVAVSWAAHFCTFLTLAPQGAPFQAPFDFDQFLSELEGALAKIEEEEKEKKIEAPGSTSRGQTYQAPLKSEAISSGEQKNTEPSHEKRDPASLFLDPAITTPIAQKEDREAKRPEPTKDSLNAYKTIMDEFTNHLSSIKNKIGNIARLSVTFKEEFSLFYQPLIDTIIIAHQQIKSRKAYQQLFLAPPEANKQFAADMKTLRKMILDTAAKIKKLDEQLVIKPQDEEVESTEALLRSLASQYQDTALPPVTVPLRSTKKVKRSHTAGHTSKPTAIQTTPLDNSKQKTITDTSTEHDDSQAETTNAPEPVI